MTRPPLPLGTWGKITRTQIAPGRWRARARYRDYDGTTRLVERFGKSGAAAERALTAALSERSRPMRGTSITRDTTVEDLADARIAGRRADDDLREQSLELYESAIATHIVPALGQVRVGEVGVGLLDAFLRSVPSTSVSKRCRVVLTGMFGLAARHDAVDHNPTRETSKRTTTKNPIRAMTVDEVAELRVLVAAWTGGNDSGPPRGLDLPEIVDTMLGTGARIGEVLAIRRADVDLTADPPTVTITGTIVKNRRQPAPKTDYSYRALVLPSFTAAALRRQIGRSFPTDEDLVFPSRTGGPRQADNVRRQLREARGETFEWVTPKVFRKTVATAIERAVDIETASAQLGHSGSTVTRLHYIERAKLGPDVRGVLDQFSPVSGGYSVGASGE